MQRTKTNLANVFRESAWSKDLEDTRGQLASRSGSWLRFLSGEWRRANRTVRAQLSNPKLPGDQMLTALDELLDGQAAQRRVQESDAQGVEAFGSNWERDRSNPAYMRGVVAWMRTLRPLGAGVRDQLADISDRALAAELATKLRPQIEKVQKALTPVHEALLTGSKNLWGDETSLPSVLFSRIGTCTASFAAAWAEARHLTDSDQLMVAQARERITLLEQEQAARVQLEKMELVGQTTFGQLWRSARSEAEVLRNALAWMHTHGELRHLAATLRDPAEKRAEAQAHLAEGEALGRDLSALSPCLPSLVPAGSRPATNEGLGDSHHAAVARVGSRSGRAAAVGGLSGSCEACRAARIR